MTQSQYLHQILLLNVEWLTRTALLTLKFLDKKFAVIPTVSHKTIKYLQDV